MTEFADDQVSLRRLETLEEYEEACAIQEEVWGVGFSERVPAAILRVAQKVGGVTAGAFAPNGRLLGFVFGITGVREGQLVHWSDMLAVRVEARGHHLGDRLKHYQRVLCREIGVREMLWTYDPLVARNAHLNINRLGARPIEYVQNLYGANTGSTLHGALPTDRFIVAWDLEAATDSPRPSASRDDFQLNDAPVANSTPGGSPCVPTTVPDAPTVLVEIPHDLQAVRATGDHLALSWRLATRATLLHYLENGYRVSGFRRGGTKSLPAYELTRSA